MDVFVKGDVVVVPFPFSDLSTSKRRPALVIANASGGDIILAQITSRNTSDNLSIAISVDDFSEGGLREMSNVRPNKLFTAESSIIAYKAGSLKPDKIKAVTAAIVNLLSPDP